MLWKKKPSNSDRICEFLKYWAQIAKENPDYQFNCQLSSDNIYHSLIFLGVHRDDMKENLATTPSRKAPNLYMNPRVISSCATPNSTFNNWIQYFSTTKNTQCFIDPQWSYFCQFLSVNPEARQSNDHLKIYVPLDVEHVEYGAKMIFDFLDQNNIPHVSKIGRRIRFDNIVIRLVHPEDVDKLLEFVNNNKYIQEGLIAPNPFAFQKDNLAMAVDGDISYNETVAKLIDLYIDYAQKNKLLNKVSTEAFYQYVNDLYQKQFTGRTDELRVAFNWKTPEEERNYREVISLILKAHNPNFTYEDYLDHFKTCVNVTLLTPENITLVNSLLLEALQTMTRKYNHPDGFRNVEIFFRTGQENLITRDNNLRYRMVNSRFREILKALLNQYKLDFYTYANRLLSENNIDLTTINYGGMTL